MYYGYTSAGARVMFAREISDLPGPEICIKGSQCEDIFFNTRSKNS